MRKARQIVILLVVTALAFAVWSYVQAFVAHQFFSGELPRPYSEMISCAVSGAVAAMVVSSLPLAAAFGRHACIAAVAVATPVLLLRVPEALFYSGHFQQEVRVMSTIESMSYLVLLMLGAWVASSLWRRRAL
jgi:hypothetical protein